MTPTRKRYTREFKIEALQRVETSGKPVPQIERALGLPSGILNRWRQRLAEPGAEAFPGQGHLPASEERLRQFERETLILRQERDILKKGYCRGLGSPGMIYSFIEAERARYPVRRRLTLK